MCNTSNSLNRIN